MPIPHPTMKLTQSTTLSLRRPARRSRSDSQMVLRFRDPSDVEHRREEHHGDLRRAGKPSRRWISAAVSITYVVAGFETGVMVYQRMPSVPRTVMLHLGPRRAGRTRRRYRRRFSNEKVLGEVVIVISELYPVDNQSVFRPPPVSLGQAKFVHGGPRARLQVQLHSQGVPVPRRTSRSRRRSAAASRVALR